jgi:multidrug efflux pump subunit AcrB
MLTFALGIVALIATPFLSVYSMKKHRAKEAMEIWNNRFRQAMADYLSAYDVLRRKKRRGLPQ